MRGGLSECNNIGLHPSSAVSTTLECMAVLFILFWVISQRPSCPVSIDSDSLGTIRAAEGASLPASDREIAQTVQIAWEIACRSTNISISHVKAHCGHPANILAYNIAKAQARGSV